MRHALALLSLAIVLAPACQNQSNTKIIVDVWSDIPVPTGLDSVRIDVTGPTATTSKTFLLTASNASGKTQLLVQFEVVPPGSANTTITVTATGLRSPTAIVSQSARISFVSGQSRLLTLSLALACEGVTTCPSDRTCAAGTCTQAIAIDNLPPYDPNKPGISPDLRAMDAGPPGAGLDGATDIVISTGGAGGGGALDAARGSAGAPGLDATLLDADLDRSPDLAIATGGVGGGSGVFDVGGDTLSGPGGAKGEGDATGLDASQPDAVVADALDAPLGGTGGTGGAIGGGGTAATGGAIGSGGAVGTGGAQGTGGILGTGGTTASCQESSTQCAVSGNGVQTCVNGQWGAAIPCGTRQTCKGPVGTAGCACTVDPMCSATGTTCASASTLITCSKDPQDCLYAAQSTCTNGACSGAAGTAACCTNACTSGTTQCVTGASLQTCAVDTSTGCTAFSAAACTGGTVCERFAPATCADPNWAEWPMPSGAVDVAGGAGNPQGYHDNNDGTITDTVTGLMWQSAVAPGTYTQPGAVTYCAATLSLASYHDWRLPTLMELVSIVDYTGTSSSHTLLPTTLAGGQYWTSTPVGNTDYVNGSPKMAWYIDFGSGVTENTQTTTTSLVRCVR